MKVEDDFMSSSCSPSHSAQSLALLDSQISSFQCIHHNAATMESMIKLITEFESVPHLLDSNLPSFIAHLSSLYLKESQSNGVSTQLTKNIGIIIYNLSKVRGTKQLSRFFSSDVYLVLPLINMIQLPNIDEMNNF